MNMCNQKCNNFITEWNGMIVYFPILYVTECQCKHSSYIQATFVTPTSVPLQDDSVFIHTPGSLRAWGRFGLFGTLRIVVQQ